MIILPTIRAILGRFMREPRLEWPPLRYEPGWVRRDLGKSPRTPRVSYVPKRKRRRQ